MKMQRNDYIRLAAMIVPMVKRWSLDGIAHDVLQSNARRFYWNTLFLTPNENGERSDLIADLYKYLDDSHIETALRAILIRRVCVALAWYYRREYRDAKRYGLDPHSHRERSTAWRLRAKKFHNVHQ